MRLKILSFLIAFVMITMVPTYGAEVTQTNAGMRMQPLISKLKTFTVSDINLALSKYSDVKTHWARPYIGKLVLLKILGGSNGKFIPDGEVNIATFLQMTVLSLGYKIAPSISIKQNWYDSYVKQALMDKLIDIGEYKDYSRPITREQAAKIMYRAGTLFQAAVEDQNSYVVMKCRIRDAAYISDKYLDSFVKSYIMGYFVLNSTAMSNPQGKLTRAQACTIVIKLLDVSQRGKFAINEDEYYVTQKGEKVYPKNIMDPVKAINVMNSYLPKAKGYVNWGGGPTGMGYEFYDNEEDFHAVYEPNMNCAITVYNDGSVRHTNYPYAMVIYHVDKFKSLHRDVFIELFKYLFEKDSDKAIAELDKFLNVSGTETLKEIKINDRYLTFHCGGGSTISVGATCKGGLTANEYIKKYFDQ